MRRLGRIVVLAAAIAGTIAAAPDAAFAQRGRSHPQSPPAHRAQPNRGRVVFIGGYFYDPFFGPYPWWSPWAYPHLYYPEYFDARATVRISSHPDELAAPAMVYVDGFYAGIVEDFDNFFEGLPLTPGGHEIVIFMEGYRTVHQRVYLAPSSTFVLRYTPERMAEGMTSEPPVIAPPVPAPPDGTYLPPARTWSTSPNATRPVATTGEAIGSLSLQVQPGDAEVRVDGELWASSDGGRYVLQVAGGKHRIEIAKVGYRTYTTDVQVRSDQKYALNVTLTPQ